MTFEKNNKKSTKISKKVSGKLIKMSKFLPRSKSKKKTIFNESPLRASGSEINEKAIEFAKNAMKIGFSLGDSTIMEKTEEFLEQLKPQNFRIALVGEMKHGKSCIFNMIIGDELSPVGESTATTAAVIELHHSDYPSYEGKWLGTEYVNKLKNYIKNNASNLRVANYNRMLEFAINSEEYEASGQIQELNSLTKIKDYATAKGQYSCAVEKVRIGLPLQELKHGATIIDTPGINDPMKVRDFITINEAKKADCVVFVMRADKLGTESERQFLLNLIQSGKAFRLLTVVTHVDRLSTENAMDKIIQQSREWLNNLSCDANKSSVISSSKIFGFDARKFENAAYKNEFVKFWEELKKSASNIDKGQEYNHWIEERKMSIKEFVTQQIERYRELIISNLPDEDELQNLKRMLERFNYLASSYRKQIIERLKTVKDRLQVDYKHLQEDLDRLADDSLKEINLEIERLVRQGGDNYYKEDHWKQFDTVTSNQIIRSRLQEFSKRIEEKIDLWNRDINNFSNEMDEIVQHNFEELQTTRNEFVGITESKHKFISLMCKVDRAIDSAENFVFGGASAYALVGTVVYLTTESSIFFSAISTLLTGGTTIPIIAGITIATWTMHRFISDAEKRKSKFIDKKLEKTKQAIDKQKNKIFETVKVDMEKIWDSYCSIASNHHTQLIQEAFASKEEAYLRLEIFQRIISDTRKHINDIESYLNSMS